MTGWVSPAVRRQRLFDAAIASDLARGDRFAPMGRSAPSFPFEVPLRQVDGLRPAPLGEDEDQQCLRTLPDGRVCLTRIEYLPDATLGGCACSAMLHPPCSYCTSTMPECPGCGWRMED